jgi:hypothetical protein
MAIEDWISKFARTAALPGHCGDVVDAPGPTATARPPHESRRARPIDRLIIYMLIINILIISLITILIIYRGGCRLLWRAGPATASADARALPASSGANDETRRGSRTSYGLAIVLVGN